MTNKTSRTREALGQDDELLTGVATHKHTGVQQTAVSIAGRQGDEVSDLPSVVQEEPGGQGGHGGPLYLQYNIHR